jgi:hypothetical protein
MLVRVLALTMAAVVFVAAVPAVAEAQDKKGRARALVIEGQKLYEAGEYSEALGRFERAFATFNSPKIQFNFGLVYDKLDRPADAIRAFQAFIAEAGDAPAANVAKAREHLARLNKKVGVLELDGDVSGGDVSVDGRSYGSQTKLILDPGPHQLTVDKVGQNSFLARLTIVAGDRSRVTVRFSDPNPTVTPPTLTPSAQQRLPPGGALPPSGGRLALDPPIGGGSMGDRGGLVPNPPPPEEKDTLPPASTPWQITAGWVSTGIAAVLLGGGLAGRLMANKKYADFNAYRDPKINMCNRAVQPDYGGAPCRERLSAGDTYAALSWIGVIGGGVAGVAAAVFFLSAPSAAPRTETALTCAPTLGHAGASCRMTF